MFSFLNRLSIVKKMILVFIFSAMLPSIFQLLFFYSKIESDLSADIDSRLASTMENKAQVIKGSFSGVMTLARKYDQNIEINQGLNTLYTDDMSYYNSYNKIKEVIVADVPYHQQVKRIALMSENPTLFDSGYVTYLEDENYYYEGEEVVQIYKDEEQEAMVFVSTIDNKYKHIKERNLTIIKYMNHYTSSQDYQNLIRIDINLQHLSVSLRELGLFDELLLIDNENRILLSSSEHGQDGNFDILDLDSLDKSVSLYQLPIQGFPIKLCGLYSRDTIINRFYEFREFNFLVSLFSLFFAAVGMYIIAGNINKRLKTVVHLSEHIADGDFSQIPQSFKGNDEFSVIENSMNIMSERLSTLIEGEYKSKLVQVKMERETVKAKLYALQSQVNPHFLFNALESIRLKSIAKDEKETASMIKHMAKMFRNLITWESDVITLEEEIEFLKGFLSIQKYRFEEDFIYEINVDEKLLTKQLPKMVIQPLVENACVHGSSSSDPLHVNISIKEIGKALKVSVIDNGGGISKERLEEIRKHLKNDIYSKNVGLSNVNQRLKLFCHNKDYYFKIESEEGVGTICELTLPANW